MNRLSVEDRVRIVRALVEGNSLRVTSRMTGASRMTIEKLLRDLSAVCNAYRNDHLRNLTCKRIHCDEIWSSEYAKQKNLPQESQALLGIPSTVNQD